MHNHLYLIDIDDSIARGNWGLPRNKIFCETKPTSCVLSIASRIRGSALDVDDNPDRKIEDDQHGHIRYNWDMRTVNISDLKAQLSAHIQLVRDGEEVLVCDRNKPVARIVPCRLADHSEQEQRLIARGVLTPPLNKRSAPVSWPEPPGNVSEKVMEQVWREEREGR
jgi:prevent-host-death family protein